MNSVVACFPLQAAEVSVHYTFKGAMSEYRATYIWFLPILPCRKIRETLLRMYEQAGATWVAFRSVAVHHLAWRLAWTSNCVG